MDLKPHCQDWEDLGELDACWAVLTTPEGKFNGWNIEEFFATGRTEIQAVMQYAASLGYPRRRARALDFGCAVGRLTLALAEYFDECWGIDIAQSMISKARAYGASRRNCHFQAYDGENLRDFEDSSFDMIYTGRVLQHIPTRALIFSYIGEFLRVLRKDGLLVFQVPARIPWRHRLQLRRRLFTFFRRIGLGKGFLYRSLRLFPIRMTSASRLSVLRALAGYGGNVLKVEPDTHCGPSIRSYTYYVTK